MDQSASYSARAYYFQQKGFDIRITRRFEEVIIEAENLGSSQLYSAILTDIDLKKYNNPLFPSLESLRKGLVEGFDPQKAHVRATIDSSAKIKLESFLKVGDKDKTITNEIQLAPKDLEQLDECERIMTKLEEQKSVSQEYKDMHYMRLFHGFLENQRALQEKVNAVAENRPVGAPGGGNKVGLGEVKELIEESVKKMNERIQKLEELVLEKVDVISGMQKNVERLEEETKKESNEKEKRDQELKGIERKYKEMEEKYDQELKNEIKKFEDNQKKTDEKIDKIEKEIEKKLEVKTKGEDNDGQGQAQIHAIKQSVGELADKMKSNHETLENDVHNKFQYVNSDIDKKLAMIKDIYVGADNRLKQLESEAKRIDKLDHKIDQIELANVKVEDRVKELEKRPQPAKDQVPASGPNKDNAKATEKIHAEFKPNLMDGDLHFTHNDKMVESPKGIAFDRTLFGKAPLPKSGRFSVSFKFGGVTRGKDGFLALGIAVGSLKDTQCVMAPGCFLINPLDKCAFLNADSQNYPGGNLNPDDIVSVNVDINGNQVEFEINGKQVINSQLNAKSFEGEDLYPCVYVQQCSDLKISFV